MGASPHDREAVGVVGSRAHVVTGQHTVPSGLEAEQLGVRDVMSDGGDDCQDDVAGHGVATAYGAVFVSWLDFNDFPAVRLHLVHGGCLCFLPPSVRLSARRSNVDDHLEAVRRPSWLPETRVPAVVGPLVGLNQGGKPWLRSGAAVGA